MDGISQSQLNTTLTGETNYFISVNGFNNETGTLEFHANVLEPLSNDKLSKAINIGDTFPYSHRQQTNTASIEPKELLSKCATNSSNSVWYQYKPKKEKISTNPVHLGSRIIKEFLNRKRVDIHVFGHVNKKGGSKVNMDKTTFFNVSHLSSEPYKLTGRKYLILNVGRNNMNYNFDSLVNKYISFEEFVGRYL